MKPWLRQDVLRHSHVTLPAAVGIEGMLWASSILKEGASWGALKSPIRTLSLQYTGLFAYSTSSEVPG